MSGCVGGCGDRPDSNDHDSNRNKNWKTSNDHYFDIDVHRRHGHMSCMRMMTRSRLTTSVE